jgi:hypothetical protein
VAKKAAPAKKAAVAKKAAPAKKAVPARRAPAKRAPAKAAAPAVPVEAAPPVAPPAPTPKPAHDLLHPAPGSEPAVVSLALMPFRFGIQSLEWVRQSMERYARKGKGKRR